MGRGLEGGAGEGEAAITTALGHFQSGQEKETETCGACTYVYSRMYMFMHVHGHAIIAINHIHNVIRFSVAA